MLARKYDVHWINCRTGSIRYQGLGDDRYYISPQGHRAQTVRGADLWPVLNEIIRELGGRESSHPLSNYTKTSARTPQQRFRRMMTDPN
jgi:hypothetical protein